MNKEQYKIITSGVDAWNEYRLNYPDVAIDLRGANLSGKDLAHAILVEADLRDSNLIATDLRWASLQAADLSWSNLYCANLSSARLRGASIVGAKLMKVVGNNSEVMTVQTNAFTVVWTKERIWIGCESYTLKEWESFTEGDVEGFDKKAVNFYREWRDILLDMFKKFENSQHE